MQAFNNDEGLKDFVLTTVGQHRAADKLIHGSYWEKGKGCAVGCTLEAVRLHKGKSARITHSNHALYESELGIPRILAYLEDRIFERLPNEDSQRWPERFISAIAPGADLILVWPRYALWVLAEELPSKVSAKYPKTTAALADVAALYREWSETGKKPERERWLTAREGALAARRDAAAYAAAAYAAAAAAYAAAYAAAAYADDYAADAADAAAAAAWRKGYDDAMRRHADKLIELLSAAPVIAAAA